jgi:cytochrome c biogenesis protein CcmG/thiol:disulfide interchange protein DsbE
MMRHAAPLAAFLALLALLAAGLAGDPALGPQAKGGFESVDLPVPEEALPPLPGENAPPGLAADDFRQAPVLVNIFASWCLPCALEHPLLMRLSRDGIPVYGIAFKDKPEDAAAWLEERGNPYVKLGLDLDGAAAVSWGASGTPESFLVDRKGRIRARFAGPLTPELVEAELRPIMAALEAEK